MTVYLDNAATTRPDPRCLERARDILTETFYNPSARYGGGFSAAARVKEARASVLSLVADAELFDVVFTSGGTEADNQAVFGCARRGNAVTTEGEHAAVFAPFSELKNRGTEPRFAPLERDGRVDGDALLSLVDEKTTLVSVIHVNNETGAVNDIAALARAVKRKNPRTVFHADGVQAFGKLPFRLTPDIDLYSVSAHKIGGLKGTGALIRRRTLALPPFLYGGGQEGNLRSGTENVFGIAVFGYAAEARRQRIGEDGRRIRLLHERFGALLGDGFLRIFPQDGSPYIFTVSVPGARGEVLQRMLFDRGVAVGTGSACNSRHRFSRVVRACGYGEDVLDGVLRISFSPETTQEEAEYAARVCNEVVREYRGKL